MKKILILILTVIGASAAFCGERFDAATWKGIQTYDAQTLSPTLGSHLGQVVGVRCNFRGKDIHHMKSNWFEGSLWQPNPQGRKGFTDVRIMVAKADVRAFKEITTDHRSSAPLVLYGKVTQDADFNFPFVRLMGRDANPDSSGNFEMRW